LALNGYLFSISLLNLTQVRRFLIQFQDYINKSAFTR
jgi:hypothetical protein